MLKIIIIVLVALAIGWGLFFWWNDSKTYMETPFVQTLGKVLGFVKDTKDGNKPNNPIDNTKKSIEQNTQKTINDVKSNLYESAKTSLDNLFNKQDDEKNGVNVNILPTTETKTDSEYIIDLSNNNNLNLKLSVNKKYYLKFKNLPSNHCLYINNSKYPLTEGTVELEFTKEGNYPLKTNSCDLNDKDIGNIVIE